MAICDRCGEELAILRDLIPYQMTGTQRRVFARLKASLGQRVSRETMLHLLYSGRSDPPMDKTVDSHVLRVRRLVAADYAIETIYSEGWRMTARARATAHG